MIIRIMYIVIFFVTIYGSIANAQHSVLVPLTEEDKARLILPDDLVYKGAFKFPKRIDGDASRWGASGGSGFTYYPYGDSTGPDDGYPGSIYGIGHYYQNYVSEISIPEPVISSTKNAAELNVAKTIQPWADITGGLRDQVGLDRLGGLAYLPKQGGQSTDKIYWTIFEYYNASATDYLSHGWSELNLSDVQAQGVWHVGPIGSSEFHSMRNADYIFEIPKSWADSHVGGKYLASGRVRSNGAFGSSKGPALTAFGPYSDGNPPAFGAELDAVHLISYSADTAPYPDYTACDEWKGGAWLTLGNKSAVMFVGTKGFGDYYYGEGRDSDCESSKGFHCTPYETQFIFYDPNDLADVVNGVKAPHEVVPYAIYRPGAVIWDKCFEHIGGMAYDRTRGLLYVVQQGAEKVTSRSTANPLAFVFSLTGDGTTDTTPPTITSVSASGSTQTVVVFSETIEHASATNVSNYGISNGIMVSGASLGSDLKTVTLTTGLHTESVSYILTVNNVKDRASIPNVIATNTQATYTLTLPDTQTPSTPTNLTAQAVSSSQINLSWNASTDNVGVTGYRIYRDGTQFSTTVNTTYQDTGLSPSTVYVYTVSAYDAAGNEAVQSSSASATTPVPPLIQTVINIGDTWKYFKGTSYPGSAWNNVTFDDSSWLEGPTGIGYGDGDDATILSDMKSYYLTVYARRVFNINDPSTLTEMLLNIDYDDGFVAYLNGQEVARAAMPSGVPAYNTRSAGHEAGTPKEFNITSYINYLVSGTNVLAVEVHNTDILSSDLSMIPELDVKTSGSISDTIPPFPPQGLSLIVQ